MSRSLHRLRAERPCDCIACVSYRLATRLLVAVLVIFVFLMIVHSGGPKPLLVETSGAGR